MSKKLYVGGLPYAVDEAQLKEVASAHGEVISVQIIKDKFSGQSKGFGFIEYANDDDAAKAISALDGSDLGGRSLKVNEARPAPSRSGGGGGGGGRGGFGGGGGGGRGGRDGGRRDSRGGGGGGGGSRW